ncbi:unnamed protein product [Rotaria socialis]|uniref:Uncharacterized protein n=1 Tax=Rotaria socialis TaxID=392032 RepID=A0A819XY40_9BILA|nr:unnamed protein product [Rotaria socialis]CAF3357499.1 unnamed protein product [Rotaria socialis]CAF3381188.1 unnamed protein product [Rotaria socialis]CAF3388173.1 unnamed protein product [Rotaria socialis]CAF3624358.1 unnamed protein product [Rotaria socialis]
MAASTRSQSNTRSSLKRSQAYQTTYRREFLLKRSSSIDEGVPPSQRFLIGCPFQLNEPVGETLYKIDFNEPKNVQRDHFMRPNTNRANRPHPHKQFPYWPRRSESVCDVPPEETRQALKNQLDSTYRVDYTGASQGFNLSMAYERSRPFWRDRARHTLDSEYRSSYPNHPKAAMHTGGRYSFSSRIPADAIVPQTLPVWKERSLRSTYGHEISQKAPSDLYMKHFVDSLDGPIG